MQDGKKVYLYTILLGANYTAMIAMSLTSKYADILIASISLTLIGYSWLLYSVKQFHPLIFNYVDVLLNIFIYTFISFSITSIALLAAELQISFFMIVFLFSPIALWAIIWTDVYFTDHRHAQEYFVKG